MTPVRMPRAFPQTLHCARGPGLQASPLQPAGLDAGGAHELDPRMAKSRSTQELNFIYNLSGAGVQHVK